jgi:site-specific DNA recombinase
MRSNYRVNKENNFEVEDAHPAIISKETFQNAQKIRESRRVVQPPISHLNLKIAKCPRGDTPLAGKYGYYKSKTNENISLPRNYYCTQQRLGKCD